MRDFFKRLFEEPNSEPDGEGEPDAVVAATALLVEAASVDGRFDRCERETIERQIVDVFGADDPAATIRRAESAHGAAVDIFKFVLPIKRDFDHGKKIKLIEALWCVIYADGRRDDAEHAMMRRLSSLLGVTDQETAAARIKMTGEGA